MRRTLCLTDHEWDVYRNDELNDPLLLRHLHECERCKKKIAEIRLLVSLMDRKPDHIAEKHPADEEILAFQYEALTPARALELESHFQTCNVCLAKLLRIKEESSKELLSERQGIIGRAVRSKLRPLDKWISLGVFVVVSMESRQGLIVHWLPQWVMSLLMSIFPRIYYPQQVLDMTVDHQGMLQLLGINELDDNDKHSPIESLQSSATPVCVEHGNLIITIDEKVGKQPNILNVRIMQKDKETPLEGLMTVLLPPEGSPVSQPTDSTGHVSIDLPSGLSYLRFESEPPVEVAILFLREKA